LHTVAIGNVLTEAKGVSNIFPVETNIIIAQLENTTVADALVLWLKQNNILCGRISENSIRMVLHLDISQEQVQFIIETISSFKQQK
jgi:threonine aldolase